MMDGWMNEGMDKWMYTTGGVCEYNSIQSVGQIKMK